MLHTDDERIFLGAYKKVRRGGGCYWNEVGLGTDITQMKMCVHLKATMMKKLI